MASKKRMLKDIAIMSNSNLEKDGIYYHIDEEDMFNVKLMIIGPKDTPYENGLYFFTLEFDKSKHPYVPPKATFCCASPRGMRMHPNFYCCGKVCLSLLNTWSGPKWSACQTLKSIATSIQIIFDDNPLSHEPGYDNEGSENAQKEYNKIISYMNFVSIYNTVKSRNRYNFTKEFSKQIEEHYRKKHKNISNKITKHLNNYNGTSDNRTFNFRLYGMKGKMEYTDLLVSLENLNKQLNI